MSGFVPRGLRELLRDFTVAVIQEREMPINLVNYAADYFNRLIYAEEHNVDPENERDPEPAGGAQNRYRRKSVSAETYNPETDEDGGDVKIVNPKSDIQRQRLADVVKNILIFRSLDPEQMVEVLDAMFEKSVHPGEHIIDQGDDGDNFYVIDSGTYNIYVDIDGQPKLVGNYDNTGFFGELALMYNMPRAATIIASSDGTIWALDRTTFRRIVLKTAFQKRKKYENLIESVPLFNSLDLYERMNIADALQSKTYQNGETIIKQGEKANVMYFVESGQVRIAMISKASPSAGEKELTVVEKGGYFGELALLTNQPRAASAYAQGNVKCALLDVGAFERLLGPCMDVMKRNIDEYEAQLSAVFGKSVTMQDLR